MSSDGRWPASCRGTIHHASEEAGGSPFLCLVMLAKAIGWHLKVRHVTMGREEVKVDSGTDSINKATILAANLPLLLHSTCPGS